MNTSLDYGTNATVFTDVADVISSTMSDALAFTLVPASKSKPCSWLEDAIEQIRRLGDLDENWDSYGAARIQRNSIRNALAIIEQLGGCIDLEQRPPTIDATPEGCVGLCWDIGGWALDLEIDGFGLIHFVYLDHFDESNDDDGCTQNLSQIIRYLSQ